MGTLDRPAEQVELLVADGIDGQVDEPALNLGPLLTHVAREAVRVLVECLMEDTHDNQPPIAARGPFGELLEQMEIDALVRRSFQTLAHFVDEHYEAAAGPGMARRDLLQRGQHACVGPGPRPAARQQPRRLIASPITARDGRVARPREGRASPACEAVTPPSRSPPCSAPASPPPDADVPYPCEGRAQGHGQA